MEQIAKHTFTKMNQDLAKSKYSPEVYFEGRNIRIITNEGFGGVSNEDGNELKLTIPDIEANPTTTKSQLNSLIYSIGNPIVLGECTINTNLYLLVKYDQNIFTIYKVTKTYDLELKFIDILEMPSVKIDVVGFYESQNIQKLYWVDGINELRFINIEADDTLELNSKFLSTVPNVLLSQLEIKGFVTGGSHTSGVIQYAYNLYKKNGAQTKISPLSSIAFLNNSNKGNDVSVQVDKAINFEIANVDTSFDRIRIYSIKYSSLNSLPRVALISEQDITNNSIDFIDDNNSLLSELTFSEFTALGGEAYYPKHLKIKDNHLFLFNYQVKAFDIDFDTRAYRFDEDGNLLLKGNSDITSTLFNIPVVPETHDAINPTNKELEEGLNFNKYIWKSVSGTTVTTNPRLADFIDIFEFVSTTNTFEDNFYDSNDQSVIFSDPSIAYSNTRNIVSTIYNVDPSLSVTSISVDGAGGAVQTQLCASATPNYPGNRTWAVTDIGGGQIQFDIQYTTDTRCNNVNEEKGVEIVINDGVTSYTLSMTIANPGNAAPQSTVEVFEFDSGGYVAEDVIGTTIDGVLGGIGPNVEYEIKYKTSTSNFGDASMLSNPNLAEVNNPTQYTGLKSGEIYRLFIEFLFKDGSYSFSKWVGDVKIPEIGTIGSSPHVNVGGLISYPYIETKLINTPNDSRIVGWRTAIVERTKFDKSIVTQGIYNSTIEDNVTPNVDVIPSYLQRTVSNAIHNPSSNNDLNKPIKLNGVTTDERNLSSNTDIFKEITADYGDYVISNEVGLIYSPETILEKKLLTTSGRVRRIGLVKNTFSHSYREVYDTNNVLVDELDYLINNRYLTTDLIQPGSTLLTNFIGNIFSQSSISGTKLCKLISSNKIDTDEDLYNNKKLAFTRYFSGLSFFATNSGSTYYSTIDNNIGYMGSILNTFNVPIFDGADTRTVSGLGNVVVKYPVDEIDGNVFKYYGGSAIIITGDAVTNITNVTELSSSDVDDYGILVEIYRVVPNQYGGDTYEARQLNKTIPYSNIVALTTNTPTTEHQGDTYIQKFNYLKTFKGNNGVTQITEIVSVPVETSVNLDLRWDILKNRPDNFEADENTSYGFNTVYNQNNNSIRNVAKPFNFEEITDYPVNVIPSSKKINNELVDSFTNFLINDVKSLDGQYGEITGVGEFKDNLFAFQRTATAYLSINPRVQLPTGDGIPIELGSGSLIERYQYLTTNSGTLNKWSIVKSTNGLMYVDLLTKSINFIDANPMKITTLNGFYNKFLNYVGDNKDVLVVDNPVIGQGIVTYYDKIKEDTYVTFLGDTSLTIGYNGLAQGFTSFYDYAPKHYINVDNKLITVNQLDQLWEHNKDAVKGSFYGTYYPSSITLVTNQNPDTNKIFNNLHFNSEFTLDGVDKSDITFTNLRVWNDYQDTGSTSLDTLNYRTTIRRRLRKWNLIIPRDSVVTRDRISNYWSYVKLTFNKTDLPIDRQDDYDFILQDILISFTMKP